MTPHAKGKMLANMLSIPFYKAQNLLAVVDYHIPDLRSMCEATLMDYIPPSAIKRLKAAIDFAHLCSSTVSEKPQKILRSYDAWSIIHPEIGHHAHEEFWAIFLRQNGSIIKTQCMAKGGMTGVVIDNRIIMREAIMCEAVRIIVAHNHPSGSTKPSKQDNIQTAKMRDAMKLLDIQLVDHIIVTKGDEFYSYADETEII